MPWLLGDIVKTKLLIKNELLAKYFYLWGTHNELFLIPRAWFSNLGPFFIPDRGAIYPFYPIAGAPIYLSGYTWKNIFKKV